MYSAQNYVDFCEKLDEFANLFEFSEGQIWDRYAAKAVPAEIVDLILKKDFSIAQIYTFVMATSNHRKIINNLQELFWELLNRLIFRIYAEGCTVYISLTNKSRIPDLVLVHKNNEKINEKEQLENPLLIIEVLSDSTENTDLITKLEEYKNVEGLQEYLIVSQKEIKVLQYSRLPNNQWLLTEYEQINDLIGIDFLNISLPMKKIYEFVEMA